MDSRDPGRTRVDLVANFRLGLTAGGDGADRRGALSATFVGVPLSGGAGMPVKEEIRLTARERAMTVHLSHAFSAQNRPLERDPL